MFGENQGRFIVTCTEQDGERLSDLASAAGLPAQRLGTTGGDYIGIADAQLCIPLTELRAAHESFFHEWMEG